ncbi:Lrp/AsnC ligand binding domain-containing protein [Coralliovum pocilloporae]|uniref:Lrp/AsnC ligand binding domain-containing protein n=1 Tax=Coralliovum pocilloporae TaxID=3066369 RepID=UPI0033076A84
MIDLDSIDRRILSALQADGRLSIVRLAERVHLTKTPCAERVKRLERLGYISGYRAVLDPDLLEANYISFVQVLLERTTTDILDRFNDAVRRIPEIQSCHMIGGGFDYLLKVRTRDVAHYRALLGDTLSLLPGVQQTHTYMVMEAIKDDPTLPVPV